jgi:hypothetical protein
VRLMLRLAARPPQHQHEPHAHPGRVVVGQAAVDKAGGWIASVPSLNAGNRFVCQKQTPG